MIKRIFAFCSRNLRVKCILCLQCISSERIFVTVRSESGEQTRPGSLRGDVLTTLSRGFDQHGAIQLSPWTATSSFSACALNRQEMEKKHMTRKAAAQIERQLKARGVYKPFVSEDSGFTYVESYPLTAMIMPVFSTEEGPHASIRITDHSLIRLGEDGRIDHTFTKFGQDVLGITANLLALHHASSYARAKAQDALCDV